jgi:hypothetical protein
MFYHSPEQLRDVAETLIDRMAQDARAGTDLSSSGMLIAINVPSPT